jgi:hypothetical protein
LDDWIEGFDNWLWYNIPSAFGWHGGVSGQAGAGVEGGTTPAEFLLLFNWRSGEASLFYSFEIFGYVGTPSVFGGNVYTGFTTVKGLSRNQFFQGPSGYLGATGSGDVFGKLGVTLIGGKAIEPDSFSKGEIPLRYFIDPISQRTIEYRQTSLFIGGNLAANAFDFGFLGGLAAAVQILNATIPFWPLVR